MGGAAGALWGANALAVLAVGVFLALVYDAVRVLRTLTRPDAMLVLLLDIAYMAFAAFVTYSAALGLTNGEVRAFLLFLEAAGFALYFLTLGRLTVGLARWVHRVAARFIFRPLLAFRDKIGVVLKKAFTQMLENAKKVRSFGKKPLKLSRKVVYNKNSERKREKRKGGVPVCGYLKK